MANPFDIFDVFGLCCDRCGYEKPDCVCGQFDYEDWRIFKVQSDQRWAEFCEAYFKATGEYPPDPALKVLAACEVKDGIDN